MTPTTPRLVLVLFYFAQLVQGISTNTTDSGCPPHDGTHRSVWSILGSCAITLLICVWHSIHFNITNDFIVGRVPFVILSFFAPEVVVALATEEWWNAREQVSHFDQKGYDWSMTHSFFAEMGGFVYRNNAEGSPRTIKSLEFLELCEASKIANPVVTVREIKDKSKSDPLGKAILALQLFWFMLQVLVRSSEGLAVTLIELDTVCMAVLSLFTLALWWDKPLRAQCPHVFYSPQEVKAESQTESLSHAWRSKPNYLNALVAHLTHPGKARSVTGDEEIALVGADSRKPSRATSRTLLEKFDHNDVSSASVFTTWTILGGLHLAAWNFVFPTGVEKMLWRVASLVLTGVPIAMSAVVIIYNNVSWLRGEKANTVLTLSSLTLGIISRAVLVALMLASLRSLPCTAYQTVSWTQYIPHL